MANLLEAITDPKTTSTGDVVDKQSMDELIANGLYAKAIRGLSHRINTEYKTIGAQNGGESVDRLHRYLLLRSYCYYKSRVGNESLELAIDDAMEAIGVADNRFQSYLMGALILFEWNRLEDCLEMLEKCLRLNPYMSRVLNPRIVYLKYKILTEIMGFPEEVSLRTAIQYRYLNECVARMRMNDLSADSIDNDFNILRLIDDSEEADNQLVLNIKNSMTHCLDSSTASPSLVDSFGDNLSTDDNNHSTNHSIDPFLWPALSMTTGPTINHYGAGDHHPALRQQQSIGGHTSTPFPTGALNRTVHSMPAGDHQSVDRESIIADNVSESGQSSLDLEFKELLVNTAPVEQPWIRVKSKWRSIQHWVDESAGSTTGAGKLCSFDDRISHSQTAAAPVANSSPVKSRQKLERRESTSSVSSSHTVQSSATAPVAGKPSHETKGYVSGPVTNLLKLRGVYVGHLKTNCPQKALLDVFKRYGSVVDFYQPSGECYAFVHYKIAESATQLVHDWNGREWAEACMPGRKVIARFTASQDQMSKYNAMSYGEYKKRCVEEPHRECDRWRSGKRCPYDRQCPYRHVLANRSVDTLPDKRKSKWKV
ncbi:unnamed protein product [Oppiella nova]|uniref:Uncharacterized protein n=1 Tax=Oppiella nova TaxID=334625 RepID=A0A7R9M8P4_9ACAR|nr:unnamed protein product [Oppiella nova]CAG2172860.1 unnamed protein product [Oppiella nova]